MDNTTRQKIQELLTKYSSIGVVVSKNPSIDHMAAGLSLFLAVKQMGKSSVIASPTQPTVEISSLVGIDRVKQSLGTDGGDLTVAFPYKEGEIEKVSYTLDNGYLNIVVKAGDKGLTFQEKEILFKRSGKAPQVLFFVGVSRLSDLGSLFNPDALKDTTIVNIDNKPDNQGFGDVVVISPRFSSVSEQIANLLTLLEDQMQIDLDIAQNLLSGITFATNDFQDPKTSPVAFEMAGKLMQKGAVRKRIATMPHEQRRDHAFFPQSQQMQKTAQHSSFQPAPQQHQQFPQRPQPQRQAPPDWLTPKVYKGSTVL